MVVKAACGQRNIFTEELQPILHILLWFVPMTDVVTPVYCTFHIRLQTWCCQCTMTQ